MSEDRAERLRKRRNRSREIVQGHDTASTKLHEGDRLEEHLTDALGTAENNETKYHIRAALQQLYLETQ